MKPKNMQKVAKTEVKAHEKRMHGMKRGGVTSMAMMKKGRNLARELDQKRSSK